MLPTIISEDLSQEDLPVCSQREMAEIIGCARICGSSLAAIDELQLSLNDAQEVHFLEASVMLFR